MNMRTIPTFSKTGLGFCLGSALALGALSLPGCLGQETGISQRHVQGVVTLPPLSLWEKEPTPKSEVAEDNNDSIETADGPYSITYAYHQIRGQAEKSCNALDQEEIESGEVETNCNLGIFDSADTDYYRIRSAYMGPIVFTGEADDGDIDITVYDGTGNVVFEDANFDTTETEDEDGETVITLNPPYFATQVENGDEFIVSVSINAGGDDPVGYSLFIAGNDPNEHNQELGFLGNTASFETGSSEPIIQDALEMKVGAYVSSDLERLGTLWAVPAASAGTTMTRQRPSGAPGTWPSSMRSPWRRTSSSTTWTMVRTTTATAWPTRVMPTRTTTATDSRWLRATATIPIPRSVPTAVIRRATARTTTVMVGLTTARTTSTMTATATARTALTSTVTASAADRRRRTPRSARATATIRMPPSTPASMWKLFRTPLTTTALEATGLSTP